MKVDFIHIGMMKTATTYMQNIWLNDVNYNLAWRGTFSLLSQLRHNIKQSNVKNEANALIQTDRQPSTKTQSVIISNEGFSTSYLNDLKFQSYIPDFIEYSSRSLAKLITSNNLLLTIREPISWIKSIYVQAIKEGWSGSAQDFVKQQEDFLLHSLDLKMIINNYSRFFNNILILPQEILKENEELFWHVISDAFGVPLLKSRLDNKLNPSLDLERTFILSKMNEMSKLLTTSLSVAEQYKNIQEKETLIKNHLGNEKWVHRRFAEYSTNQEVQEMYRIFNLAMPDEGFLNFVLPKHVLESIQKNYIDFLGENTIPEIAEEYQKKNYLKSCKII